MKVDSNELKVSWFQLKVDSNELKVSWFQLKVDSNELKVSWFQLKSFLINRSLWGSKGKSIESRFKWIESKLISIEILSYQ